MLRWDTAHMCSVPHLGLDLPTTCEDRTHIVVTSFPTSGAAHKHQHATFLPRDLSRSLKRDMSPGKSGVQATINDHAYFEHQRLDPSKDEIRLVRLLPGTSSDDIQCELKVLELASAPSYIALSYVWGDAGFTRPIHVDGKLLQVRNNLFDFMSIYRNAEDDATGKETWLWIDQLCIDQSNVQEKNHQVRLMSRIYKGSLSVVAWLGCDQDLVAAATEFADTGEYECLEPIFHSRYFTRLWIVQEILLAPSLRVLCGDIRLSLETMRELAEICSWHHCPNVPLSLFSEGATDFEIYDDTVVDTRSSAGRPNTLKACVERYSGNHCEDPRDKVYGLLGLVDEVDLEVNYEKTVEEVFLDAMEVISSYIGKGHAIGHQRFLSLATLLAQNMGMSTHNLGDRFKKLNDIFEQSYERWRWGIADQKQGSCSSNRET
ncbi:heterokaryon incompatibility protein-domain-containing protein [Paraphoma chrysanthemicola]|uniref:Heterokaryon incompatibility protein-domain-containing protein n=1 Tax=Paraphoma chrysanthemicola TaxID=798071 RepID=A0A8K0VS25_9PLEO|nr:heterokaryon incompatibility protein-domain-containing protein [Paraphoma chrysanthemicola]